MGIKSVILIPIIIAKENAKEKVINLLILFSLNLKNITKAPIIVDKPAIVEISKDIANCILSPIKSYVKI